MREVGSFTMSKEESHYFLVISTHRRSTVILKRALYNLLTTLWDILLIFSLPVLTINGRIQPGTSAADCERLN